MHAGDLNGGFGYLQETRKEAADACMRFERSLGYLQETRKEAENACRRL